MCGSLQEASAESEKDLSKLLDHQAAEANRASAILFILTLYHHYISEMLFSLYTYCMFVNNPDNEGDFGSVEARMPLGTFLNECAGKVTVLIGPSGSGKSFLMSHLGQQWARKLVSVQHTFLLSF